MDKIVDLKKLSNERKNSAMIPQISFQETIHYLKCYYLSSNNSPSQQKIIHCIDKEIVKKRLSYKNQDIRKKKYNERTFISKEQIYDKMISSHMLCYYCKGKVCLFYSKVRQHDQWTLERIDNTFGHSDINTAIACLDCNLKRRNKNSNAFQFAKQMVIKKV
tara:strand:- start:2187 stop:2672 length:486 start_codon:yes stop_codon:yes gene_type:complete